MNKMIIMSFIVILSSIFFSSTVFGDDIDTLRTRLYNYYRETETSSTSYLSSMNSDGSWSDIEYDDTSSSFPQLAHITRLRYLSAAYNDSTSSYYHSDTLLISIEAGLNYWYTVDPESTSGWENEIGLQLELMPVLMLMYAYIDNDLLITGCDYLSSDGTYYNLTSGGENTVWVCSEIIHKGVLINDSSYIEEGVDCLISTLDIVSADEEGISPDYSFHQHDLLYNLGYGRQYIEDESWWAYMVRDLIFSFSDESIKALSKLILEGTQWMTYFDDSDYAPLGRGLVRKKAFKDVTSMLLTPLQYMIDLDTENNEKYSNYIDNINGVSCTKTGDKHFWCSDYHVHRRTNYIVTINMSSTRTIATEHLGTQNIKGYFIGSGSMFIESNTGAYYNIPPVWNWCRLPGVTCAQTDAPPTIPDYLYGTTDFVGGVTDSICGVAAMDYERDNTYGKKCWFLFEDEIVALGAGITSTNSENIFTTLNQQLKKGTISYFDTQVHSVSEGEYEIDNVKWIYHDNVAYVLPDQVTINISNTSQSGSWSDINPSYTDTSSVSEDIFTAWIDHGAEPQDSSYYYVIVPGIDSTDVNMYVNNFPITLLCNTDSIQAVKNDSLEMTGIVFYETGSLDLEGSNLSSISVDMPCILLLDENNNYMSASNPLQTEEDLTVKFTYTNGTSDSLIFYFPGGDYGGLSIKKSLPYLCNDFKLSGEATETVFGINKGSITLSVDGGTEPYNYFWSDSITSKNRTNLAAGDYSVQVSDNNECELSDTFIISNVTYNGEIVDKMWTGDGGNTSWTDENNWYSNDDSDADAVVLIPSGKSYYPEIAVSDTLGNLIIEDGATMTMNDSAYVVINNNLITNGGLIINNTPDAPPALLVGGNITGEAIVNWSLERNRGWYLGYCVDSATIINYPDSYLIYDNSSLSWDAGIGSGGIDAIGIYFSTGDNEGIFSYKGVLTNENFTFNSETTTGNKYQMITNPYSAYLDLDSIYESDICVGFNATFHVNDDSGDVFTYNAASGYTVSNDSVENGRYIAPGQSFWVQLEDEVTEIPSLLLKNTYCLHQSNISLKSEMDVNAILRLNLTNGSEEDQTLIVFADFGSTSFSVSDSQKKCGNESLGKLYTLKDDYEVVINSMPIAYNGEVVSLGYSLNSADTTELSLDVLELSGFDDSLSVYLDDLVADVSVELKDSVKYKFTASSLHSNDRFQIRIASAETTDIERAIINDELASNINVYSCGQIAYVEVCEDWLVASNRMICVYNLYGQLVKEEKLNDLEFQFYLPGTGIYLIKVISGSKIYTKKVLGQL